MPFHKFVLLCYVLFGLLLPVSAQQHEFGAVVGISGYVGELARKNTLLNSGARANDRFIAFDNGGVSAFYQYRFSENRQSFLLRGAGFRVNLSYMRIGAEQDGFIFSSNLYEFATLYEKGIYRFVVSKRHLLEIYGLAGAGLNVHAVRKNGRGIQNFSNDPDITKERLALSIPLGGGIRWQPKGDNGPWSIGIEALGRMTSDKLDNIYPGFPSANPGADPGPNNFFFDIYKMLGIRISYTLFNCDCPQWR